MRASEFISEAETYHPPALSVGDKILKGKFKNSPAEIKGFSKDKHNQPVLKTNKGEVQLFKPRISKLMKEEELTELFAPGKNWQWSFTGSKEAAARFVIGKVRYTFTATTHPDTPGEWSLIFQDVDRKARPASGGPGKYGLTGTGNSTEVMSTIADIIRSFLEKYQGNVTQLTFSADEDSRQGLYAKMAKRLLPNWTLVKDGIHLTLTAPEAIQ